MNKKSEQFNRGNGCYLQQRNGKDLLEGPWRNETEALAFFDAEVGVTCRLVSVYTQCSPAAINPLTGWLKPLI